MDALIFKGVWAVMSKLSENKKLKRASTPNSPFATLNATEAELQEAFQRASVLLTKPIDDSGRMPYAVLVGYKDKNGRIRLLNDFCIFTTKAGFERSAGNQRREPIGVISDQQK